MRSNSSSDALRTPWSRWLIAVCVTLTPAVVAFGCGHPGVHAAHSFLIPGAGMLEAQPVIAVMFMVCAAAGTTAWLLWGNRLACCIDCRRVDGCLSRVGQHDTRGRWGRS